MRILALLVPRTSFDWIIIIASVLILFWGKRNYDELRSVKKELDRELSGDYFSRLDAIHFKEKDFSNYCSTHDVLAQLIPLFPLVGLLGTVWGLMQSVQAGDISQMMASLDTALSSTFFGLIASIALKFFDSFPAKLIRSVEIALDNFYWKYDKKNK